MLQSNPTKKGTGIEFWGDYGDLKNLYKTIHKIGEKLDGYNSREKGQSDIIMNFAYELRKSFEHSRLKEKFSFDSENEVEYYGFRYIWTDLLYLISVLRDVAGYVVLDELDQANLYILEHNTKKSLFEYDPQGAEQIQHFIGQRIMTSHELVSLVSTSISIDFLIKTPGKKRFREIPNLLIAYSQLSKTYEIWKKNLEKEAKKLNCEMHEITYKELPNFEW